jgi:hypothetical protein
MDRRIAMKAKLFLRAFVCLTLLTLTISASGQSLITFDDLSETGSGSFLQNGYHGLNWNNFLCNNAILFANEFGLCGDYYGMVSASNVASCGSEIASPGTNFNFLSAYLTGVWRSNLSIEVQGFSGTNLLYDQIVVASATNPTLFAFNYLDIDSLTFSSFGGQNAGFVVGGGLQGSGEQFAMDNLSFEFVPEPSTVLLAALGALTLYASLKPKRA